MSNSLIQISKEWTSNHFVTLIIFTTLLSVSRSAPFACYTGVNCLTCLNNTYCQTCYSGQGIATDGSCIYCTDYPNCQTCNGSNTSECLTCIANFTLTSSNTCQNNNNCFDL